MWHSESKRFAPNGAKSSFSPVVVYKHLAANGAKPTTSNRTGSLLPELLETGH